MAGRPQRPGGRVEVLYPAAVIARRVEELAVDIAHRHGPDLLVVALLKGSFVFTADLLRALHRQGVHPRVDFMTLQSYGAAAVSSGRVEVTRDLQEDVAGQDVVVVDDILESGRTLETARNLLLGRGAATVEICVLLEKPGKRAVELAADHVGFVIPDRFVVGYGLDYAHYYRELPYIGVIETS